MEDALDKLLENITRLRTVQQEKILTLSEAIKKAHGPHGTDEDRSNVKISAKQLDELGKQIEKLLVEGESLLPPDIVEELTKQPKPKQGEQPPRLHRRQLTAQNVSSTGRLEDYLPNGLERLLSIVSSSWLREEAKKPYRLDRSYLEAPLSLVAGGRTESEQSPLHRFAHSILLSYDFLENRSDYDFHAGALLVPQVGRLGDLLPLLHEIKGDVNNRLRSLSRGDTELVDSTILELFVAGACAKRGHDVELLSPSQSKTPDIRLHNSGVPTVIECKRKRFLSTYELTEEHTVRTLFEYMYKECLNIGIYGTFEAIFDCDIEKISPNDFAQCARRQARFAEGAAVKYPWGTLAYKHLPKNVTVNSTPLYSPDFLRATFSWNYDIPQFDGLVCRVDPPAEILTDRASQPIALLWKNISQLAIWKKARLMGDLLKSATEQIPLGELGFVYLCYREGGRPEVADDRTRAVFEQMKDWRFDSAAVIPAIFLQRLYPRALGEGQPDLIENSVWWIASFADPEVADDLPRAIFTP